MTNPKRPHCTVGECTNLTEQIRRKDASVRYRSRCYKHASMRNLYRRPYLAHKKDHCERCGFVAENLCQLDVDHIDGNHSNNDPSNLSTLCANCHRLKTYLRKEMSHNRKDLL